MVGSPFYVAPEVLEGKYDKACDVWSFGVMMYVFLSGSPPFYSSNKADLYNQIKNKEVSFSSSVWKDISSSAIHIIKDLLKKDPTKRPKANVIMAYPWFSKYLEGEYSLKNVKQDILKSMKSFQKPKKLTSSILKFVVKNMEEDELGSLKKAFISLDENKTGFISIENLKKAFEAYDSCINNSELENIIKNCEIYGHMGINYTSFIAVAIDKKKLLNKDLLWSTFKQIDIEDKNYITVKEMEKAIKRTGKSKKYQNVAEMFIECGFEENAKITFDEFKSMLDKAL
jgi:calcium-dependent protein kinase